MIAQAHQGIQRIRRTPHLAEAGRRLLYQFGVGLAFLATVRADGGPRLHPMCPLVTDDALLGFLQPSPKRGDLHRDGRYALHAFPPDDNEDAFYVGGRAVLVDDRTRRRAATAQFLAERKLKAAPPDFNAQDLFEFHLERCLWTQTSAMATGTPTTRSGGRDSPAQSAPPKKSLQPPVRPTPKILYISTGGSWCCSIPALHRAGMCDRAGVCCVSG